MEKHVYVRVNGFPIARIRIVPSPIPGLRFSTVMIAEVLQSIYDELLPSVDLSVQEVVSWSLEDTTWMDRLEGRSEVRRPVLEGGSVDGT